MSNLHATILSLIVVGILLGYWIGGVWGAVLVPVAGFVLLAYLGGRKDGKNKKKSTHA